MLLGSAGTGKTSLKHSLMEEPFNPHTTSTIVSDVSSVRPFGHKWQTMKENKWRETTEEDEIDELSHLFNSRHSKSSAHHTSVSVSTSSITSNLGIESSFIQSILRRVTPSSKPSLTLHSKHSISYQKTKSLVQPFLHIWDCGGQPVFLEILPAFLTPRTMFLLLFDASKDFREKWHSSQNTPDGEVLVGEVVNESTSDLMAKWMSTIHSYLMKHNKDNTSPPSIYCIGTRGDKLNSESKKEVKQQIQSLYQEKEFSDLIKDVLIIDNTTSGKGDREDLSITELRGAIESFIYKSVVKTPVNWVLFRKVFQKLKHNVISVSDAVAIGVACHIPAADVPDVLKFYHELGAILYYPQIKGLKDKVILNPKWFVDTIGKVFPLKKGWSGGKKWSLFQSKGILIDELYKDIWPQSSGIDPKEIIKLLVHFRLAAPVQTEHYDSRSKQYFVPAVLPGYTGDPNKVRPGYKLRASPVHITFSTGYVPPGFFTRLVTAVATNANVKLKVTHSKVEIKSIYRNRVCFSYGHPSDDFVLTDINEVIQVDVLRYVPDNIHPVPFKTVCQRALKLAKKCCHQVEDTLYGYHGHHIAQSLSRNVCYVCECESFSSSKAHYIKVNTGKQTCSDPVYCDKIESARSLTQRESMWFEGEFKDKLSFLKYLFLGVGLFSLIILLMLVGSLFTDIVNINSTTADKANILTISDLREVLDVLKDGHFPRNKWFKLGLSLDLLNPELDAIENNFPKDNERCLQKCLTLWLKEDIEATWSKLADAVDKTEEKAVAGYIRTIKVKNKKEL